MSELSDRVYVDGGGVLMYDNSKNPFIPRRPDTPVLGIEVYQLWCDSYEANLKLPDAILFPADMCSPFPFKVEGYTPMKAREFVEKGGGFRLDFLTR